MQETQVHSLGQEDELEEEMATAPVFLLRRSIDRGAWRATVHGSIESGTTEHIYKFIDMIPYIYHEQDKKQFIK